MAHAQSVIAVVPSQNAAEQAVTQLKEAGVSPEEISALFPDKRGAHDFALEHHTKAPEGALAGVGVGGVLGGTLGALAGIGALAIPGVGPLIAAGPILATLSGAAAGATVGGVAGALVGLGMPEFEAKQYEGKLKEGNILLSVHVDDRDTERLAKRALERAGASKVVSTGEARA
ncbi:MAG: DUF3341 domain-containing protein [Myxococcales bacterium]|jgi:hypothetical protein|nr:DUF3341 domain-containing protein [Myxococcales bacterium]